MEGTVGKVVECHGNTLFPRSIDQLQWLLYHWVAKDIPIFDKSVIAVGANGTHQQAPIIISMGHMNRILEVLPGDQIVRVEAGVRLSDLQKELGKHNLWMPIDNVDRDATIGGMLALDTASASNVKHGSIRNQVVNLSVLLPDGKLVDTSVHPPSQSGNGKRSKTPLDYVTGLFIGSEGTLGVIVEATLRVVHRYPIDVLHYESDSKDVLEAAWALAQLQDYPIDAAYCVEGEAWIVTSGPLRSTITNTLLSTFPDLKKLQSEDRGTMDVSINMAWNKLSSSQVSVSLPLSKVLDTLKELKQRCPECTIHGRILDGTFFVAYPRSVENLASTPPVSIRPLCKIVWASGGSCTPVNQKHFAAEEELSSTAGKVVQTLRRAIDPKEILSSTIYLARH